MAKVIAIILGIIVAVLVGLGVWGFVSGKVVVAGVNGVAAGDDSYIVCDDDLILKYNDAMYMIPREGAAEPSMDKAALTEIKNTINSTEGSKSDPSCQAMLFWIAIYEQDHAAGKSAMDIVESLHKQHIYANSNIRSNEALFVYEGSLYSISEEAQRTTEGLGD